MMSRQTHLPTEAEIEAQLSQFQPLPTTRFYEKMQAIEWQTLDATLPAQSNGHRRMMRFTRNRLLAAALFFVVIGLSIALLPSLQALAQDMLRYFERAESNQMETRYVPPLITPTPGPYKDFYTLNDEESSQKAGFDVRVPPLLPDDLQFEGASANEGFAHLEFRSMIRFPSSEGLGLTQTLVGGPVTITNEVGPDAKVETIDIAPGIVAEYSEGGWQLVSPDPYGHSTPGVPMTHVYEWHDIGGKFLIWEADGVRYILNPSGGIAKANLIAIARCMYVPYDLLEPNARLGEQRRNFRDKNIDCDLDSGVVTQAFIGPNQFVVFRQQPISAENPMPSVVEGGVTNSVPLTMPSGSLAEAEVIEGLWTGTIPDSHRLRNVSAEATGLRWEADGLRLEAWIVGEGMNQMAITLPTLIEIAQTLQ